MVNTFVTDNDPVQCAKNLDYRRLGKQRVEAFQLLNVLLERGDKTKGWSNHPALLMWKGYENGLKYYLNCMIDEWINRGYNNTMAHEVYDVDDADNNDGDTDNNGGDTDNNGGDTDNNGGVTDDDAADTGEDEKSIIILMPWWFNCYQLQLSHKCSLLRKDYDHYSKVFHLTQEEKDNYFLEGYIWPSKLTPKEKKLLKQNKLPFSSFEPLGSGTPAQYRISLEVLQEWLLNKNINPLTKRKITANGTIYKDYEKAAIYHGLL
jgi:hypothetical protein